MRNPNELTICRLTRIEVIRLTGSTARLDYEPPPKPPSTYCGGLEQDRITDDFKRDMAKVVALRMLGLPNAVIGLAYGVSRHAVEQRLKRIGLVRVGTRGGPQPQREVSAVRRPLARGR